MAIYRSRTDPPTEPGWYYGNDGDGIHPVNIKYSARILYYYDLEGDWNSRLDEVSWYGPVDEIIEVEN